MKPKHQRLLFIAVSVVFLCASALLVLQSFKDNLVFFYTPSELAEKAVGPGRLIRIGGLVETGSVKRTADDRAEFILTDGSGHLSVTYKGMLPSLFREGQGAVVEGHLAGDRFTATRVLIKHDEQYMPREVVEALKRSGRWQSPTPPNGGAR